MKLPASSPLKYASHTDEITSDTRSCANKRPSCPGALAFPARSALKSLANALTLSPTVRTRSPTRWRSSSGFLREGGEAYAGGIRAKRLMRRRSRRAGIRGVCRRDPWLIATSSGLGLVDGLMMGRAMDIAFFVGNAVAVGEEEGEDEEDDEDDEEKEGDPRIPGHSSSSVILPPSTLVPSRVPLLQSVNP